MLNVSALVLVSFFAQQNVPVIVDTDAGVDDLMAIAFLLSRSDIQIEAITVANGLAHVDAGALNIRRLLELSGRAGIPVYRGSGSPMRGDAAFPEEWRRTSDDLPGVDLPRVAGQATDLGAVNFYVHRLSDRNRPVRILALGPLTNLGEALQRSPEIAGTIQELVIMGGAVRARGNLDDGGYFKTDNKTAEWNMFIDPVAARIVFGAGISIEMIGLDATNKVHIDLAFLNQLQGSAKSALGRFVAQVLGSERDLVTQGFYYAWDPLAAVALVDPRVVAFTPLHIEIRQNPPEAGRTAETPGQPNARVALDANGTTFRAVFLHAFAK